MSDSWDGGGWDGGWDSGYGSEYGDGSDGATYSYDDFGIDVGDNEGGASIEDIMAYQSSLDGTGFGSNDKFATPTFDELTAWVQSNGFNVTPEEIAGALGLNDVPETTMATTPVDTMGQRAFTDFGISRDQRDQIARELGYTGLFGGGALSDYRAANPDWNAKFEAAMGGANPQLASGGGMSLGTFNMGGPRTTEELTAIMDERDRNTTPGYAVGSLPNDFGYRTEEDLAGIMSGRDSTGEGTGMAIGGSTLTHTPGDYSLDPTIGNEVAGMTGEGWMPGWLANINDYLKTGKLSSGGERTLVGMLAPPGFGPVVQGVSALANWARENGYSVTDPTFPDASNQMQSDGDDVGGTGSGLSPGLGGGITPAGAGAGSFPLLEGGSGADYPVGGGSGDFWSDFKLNRLSPEWVPEGGNQSQFQLQQPAMTQPIQPPATPPMAFGDVGMSRDQRDQLARDYGYTGDFGGGTFMNWRGANPSWNTNFEDALRRFQGGTPFNELLRPSPVF